MVNDRGCRALIVCARHNNGFWLGSVSPGLLPDSVASPFSKNPTRPMNLRRFLRSALLLLCVAWAPHALAQLTVEIIGGAGKQFPIAVVPFAQEPAGQQTLSQIIGADLARSGLFRVIDVAGVNPLPSEPSEINYADFRGRAADGIVIGSIKPADASQVDVKFRLMDSIKQAQITGAVITAGNANLRGTAHRIADMIYEAITGERGIFSTRVAYIVNAGRRTEVQVADADGFGPQTVFSSNDPVISLA